MKYVILTVTLLLIGCSSAPTKTASFCDTSKTIKIINGTNVSSEEVHKCATAFLDRHVPAQAGVDRNCREVITQFGRNYVCETHRPGYYVYISDPANLSK